MEYVITGVSNKTLPIELREKFAIPAEQRAELLARCHATKGVGECMVLSTCNRTEIHAAVTSQEIALGLQRALCEFTGISHGSVGESWYTHGNGAAVRHLFRVASSLDSMVVGEPQIFSQVKDAFQAAFSAGRTGNILNQILHRAFFVAKRVRTETGIGLGSASVSSVAVDLIESSICARYTPTLLVVGMGEIGKAAAKTFRDRGLGKLILINRTHEKAVALAGELGAETAAWDDLGSLLEHADAVVTSCGTGQAILTREMVAISRSKTVKGQLVIVDLGVPRDVEPEVASVPGVILHNIDDLKQVAGENMEQRWKEVEAAEQIVTAEAKQTSVMLLESRLEPTIASLMQKCEEIRRREIERAFDRMEGITPEHRQIIETCTTSIISKILHDPIITLKKGVADEEPKHQLLDFLRHIFRLD